MGHDDFCSTYTRMCVMQEVAASWQQQAALGKSAERNPRKGAKQVRGPDKQMVERKRKADAALDDMAGQPSQGRPCHNPADMTSTLCIALGPA